MAHILVYQIIIICNNLFAIIYSIKYVYITINTLIFYILFIAASNGYKYVIDVYYMYVTRNDVFRILTNTIIILTIAHSLVK